MFYAVINLAGDVSNRVSSYIMTKENKHCNLQIIYQLFKNHFFQKNKEVCYGMEKELAVVL